MGSERISEGPPVVQADDRNVHQEVAHALSLARAALESTTDGLLVVDHQGRIVISNQRFLELWRIPAELAARGVDAEVLAFVVEQLVDPAAFVAKVHDLYARPDAESFDVLAFRDGRLFERYSRPQLVDGVAVGRVWSFRDVTERTMVEESRFRSVTESARDAVITADSEGAIIGWNRGARETFGYDVAEIVSAPLTRLMPERYRAPHDRGFARFRETREGKVLGRTLEMFALRKDETEFPCEITINSWTAGGRVFFNAFVRDITERRRAEAALLLQARILESMKESVVVTDEQGTIQYANPALYRTFGYEQGELIGQPVTVLEALGPPDSRPRIESVLAEVVRTGQWVGDCFNTRKDGSTFTSEVSITSLVTDDRKLFVCVQDDVTEQRALRTKVLIGDRMASVGTLAAGIAHEINNPLAYVTANLDLAVEELQRVSSALSADHLQELAAMLGSAKDGADRVRKIVRGLKTFSRADQETIVPLDVIRVIEWSINMTFNEIRHRARVVKDYGKTPLIEADEARLGQVFVNLLVNAAQSIPEGRAEQNVIRIATGTDRGRAFVEIVDTGGGIAPDVLPRIFDPFFTTKPVGQGTGLGLSICHTIVTALGGEISVESTLGHGTVFRVTLPSAVQAPAPERNLPPTEPEAVRRAHVLVIDDDEVVGTTIARALRGHGTRVVTRAREALDLLAAGESFDVIFCDLMMPEMTGPEFYDELVRTMPAFAERVVFVTGGAFTSSARSFLDRIANETVEKPFEVRALRALVARFLR